MPLISDLVTKRSRVSINHKRVVCFCDTSSANALSQCQAYYAAYPNLDSNLIFQYDLSTAGAKTLSTAWGLWVKDWCEFLVANNAEAVCCNPELDIDNPFYSSTYNYSFLNWLASGVTLLNLMNAQERTELPSSKLGYFFNGYNDPDLTTSGTQFQEFSGTNPPDIGLEYNSFLPTSITSGAGDNVYDYAKKGSIDSDERQRASRGQFTYDWELGSDFNNQPGTYLPSWRIGWKSGNYNPPEITTSEITAMVNRSIANKGSISSFKEKPIVSSSRVRVSGTYEDYFAGQAMLVDTIFKDMGFLDTKWGYSEDQSGESELTTWNSKLSTDNYDPDETTNTNVQFKLDNVAGTVGSAYRDLGSNYSVEDNWKWHAHNTNTFPMDAFIYIGGCLVNMNVQTSGSWCDGGSDAVFNIEDGAFLFEMTSHFLRYGGWAIKNGASAIYGSHIEPTPQPVSHAGSVATNLLRGHEVASSVLYGQNSSPDRAELWGDGLASPFYQESIEEETYMNSVKFQLTATTAYVTYGGTVPSVTNGGTGHAVGDIITLNGSAGGAGVRVKVASLGASDAVATYTWVSGGSGWANSEVATQSSTTGSGTTLVFTMPSNLTTAASPVGFGFFSEPLVSEVATQTSPNILYNNEGMEFAFSEFSPSIPDVHAIIGVPTSNGFFAAAGFHVWVEGDLSENPYGGNLTLYVNGTGYPILQEYFDNNSVTWEGSNAGTADGFSRLIWKQTGVTNPLPVTILEGDNIGLSLAVPDRASGSSIERSIITHNTISKG